MSQNILNNLSWIQYHVLIELTRHSTRRYSELRPKDVEGNLFMYHLKGLLSDKLVEKNEKLYQLTPKGRHFISTLSLVTDRVRKQPQILTALIARNEAGEYLWSRWHRQPNTDRVSFPHGMLHYGEDLTHMAARELAEKAGLVAGELRYRGHVYIRVMADDQAQQHMLVHLFAATHLTPGRQDEFRPDVSEPFWAPLASIPQAEFLRGFYQIAQLVETQSSERIFADIAVNSGE